jgi:hypothetical protein
MTSTTVATSRKTHALQKGDTVFVPQGQGHKDTASPLAGILGGLWVPRGSSSPDENASSRCAIYTITTESEDLVSIRTEFQKATSEECGLLKPAGANQPRRHVKDRRGDFLG